MEYKALLNPKYEAESKTELDRQRESASVVDKINSFGISFSNASMSFEGFSKVKEYASSQYHHEDKLLIEDLKDDEFVGNIIDEYNLHPNDFADIIKAKNEIHLSQIITDLKTKRDRLDFVNKTSSEFQQGLGTVSGAIIDIDTLMVGPLSAMFQAGKGTLGVAKTAATVETAGAVAKYNMSDSYTFKDAVFDVAVGTIADTAITKAMGYKAKSDIDSHITNVVDDYKAIKMAEETIPDVAKSNRSDFFKRQEELSNEGTQYSEAQFEQIRAEHRQRRYDEFDKQNQARIDAEKQSATEQKIKSQINVSTPYSQIQKERELTVNKRKDFFKRQDEIIAETKDNAFILDSKLSKINANIKTVGKNIDNINSEISSLNKKINSTTDKKWKTRYENQRQKKLEEKEIENKKLEDEKAKLKSDLTLREIEVQEFKTKQTKEMVEEISAHIDIRIDQIKLDLDDLKNSSPEEIDDYIKTTKDVYSELTKKYPDKMKEINDGINAIKNNKPLTLNSFSAKQKATIAALGLFGVSSAQASDGSEDTYFYEAMVLTILGVAFGPSVISNLKSGKFKDNINSLLKESDNAGNVANYKASEDGKKTMNYWNELHQRLNTSFNSTYQELSKFKSESINKLRDKLLLNPIDGSMQTLDVEKLTMLRGEQSKVAYSLKEGFRGYVDNLKVKNRFDFLEIDKHREDYNKLLSDIVEGNKKSEIPEVNKAANDVSKIWNDALGYAKEVGVKNADLIKPSGNYLPRLWKFNALGELISGADEASKKIITQQFANMFVDSADSYKSAEKLMSWFTNVKNFEGKQADEILERLSDFLKDDVDLAKAKDELTTTADASSRLKGRLNLNLSRWEDIEVTVNGQKVNIGLEDIVERNIQDVSDMYLNQMYGSIALAKRGWKTVSQLRNEINTATEGMPEAKESLDIIADLLMGYPPKVNNKQVHEWSQFGKGVAFANTLPLVAFSMIPEMIKTIQYAGLPMTLKHLTNSFKTMNKDSELFKTLTETTGLGTHSIRDRLDFKGIDNVDYGEIKTTSKIAQAGIKMQEATARMSGLVKFSDVFQRITLVKSATDVANFVKGNKHDIPKSRMQSYGLDEKFIEEFKDDFEFVGGELKAIDTSKWSYKKRARYNDVMFRMNQEITPEVVLGTTGRWTKDTDIGRMLSFLISYPLNLFSNQAIKDAHFRDTRAFTNAYLTFAGSYIGLVARYEAMGKEYTHEDIVKYSIMNMPSAGLVGATRAVADPAVFNVWSGFKDDIDAIASGAIDEVIE
jgi:hypothetical protein